MGGSIGVAILGAIQVSVFGSKLAGLSAVAPSGSKAILSDPNLIGHILVSPQALSQLILSNPFLNHLIPMIREAFSQSILSLFWVQLGVSIATFAAILLMKEMQVRQKAGGSLANMDKNSSDSFLQ